MALKDTPDGKIGDAGQLRLADYLPYRLAVTSNLVSRLVARAYQDAFGVSIWEWRVLAILGEGVPMTAQSVCDSAAMDKVSVSRAVRSLVGRGLVARHDNTADRRSRLLQLTAAGQSLYDAITPVALEREAALLDGFDETDAALLAQLLDRLRASADELAGDAKTPDTPAR
mgnify:CR=1 FL=1